MKVPRRVKTAATHESGHVVMRWLLGLDFTDVEVTEDGGGFCHGTGQQLNAQTALDIALSGIAAEIGYAWRVIDLETSSFEDLNNARAILADSASLRAVANMKGEVIAVDIEDALRVQFQQVCNRLRPHRTLVEVLSKKLGAKRMLSASEVELIIAKHSAKGER